jgi:hypothetical protein
MNLKRLLIGPLFEFENKLISLIKTPSFLFKIWLKTDAFVKDQNTDVFTTLFLV